MTLVVEVSDKGRNKQLATECSYTVEVGSNHLITLIKLINLSINYRFNQKIFWAFSFNLVAFRFSFA